MGDITITAEPLPPMEELEALWRGLDHAGTHAFFLTWTWMGTWLRTIPPSHRRILLKARDTDRLIGLATLTLRRGKIRGLIPIRQAWLNATGDPAFDCITIEHNGFAAADLNGGQALNALSKSFATGAISADELVLPGVAPAREHAIDLLPVERCSPGFRASLKHLDGIAGVETLLSRNARQQLRRNIRGWQDKGTLSIEVAQDPQTALEFFEGLKRLHVSSWNRRDRSHAFVNPFFETFHRALISTGLHDGNIDLLRINAGAHVVGYLYNFRRNGTVSSYQSGFDDTNPSLRPGYVCHALAMAHYAAGGMTHYDFLAGSNRLKQSLGSDRYELFWRRLRKPKLAFRLETLLRAGVKRVTGAT